MGDEIIMTQTTANFILGAVAVLWPMLITALDRAYGRGEMKGKLNQIERDLSEIRGMFTLTIKSNDGTKDGR
jgi:hypothetical protein